MAYTMLMIVKLEDEHLGDGVYASFDGYHVWLDLRAQDDFTRIAIEPRVMTALIRYYHRAYPSSDDPQSPQS